MLAESGRTLKELRQEINQKYGERYYKESNYEYEPKDIDIIRNTIAAIEPEKMYDCVPLTAYKDYDGFRWEWEYGTRSEEHRSELQSRGHLVCRRRLEKNN